MLVATFGPSTTWVGKTVTYVDGAFVLEGHGPIRAQDVFEYERQGHLVWAMDGVRAWVGAKAQEEGGLVATPTLTSDWQQGPSQATPTREAAPLRFEPQWGEGPAEPVQTAAEPGPEAVDPAAGARPLDADAEAIPPEPDAEAAPDEPVAGQPAETEVVDSATTLATPAFSAEDAGLVLAAEPADLTGIAAAAAAATGKAAGDPALEAIPEDQGTAAAAPAPDPAEDAFAGLGADDPARARAIEEAARAHDWTRLTALYALQAWWLDEEGRDALQVTRLARRAELRAFLDQGVTLVRVAAADEDTCEACRRVAGRAMTIADALRLMPIPDASCAYKWCRCVWESADPVPSP
jgi:hypothetical protein